MMDSVGLVVDRFLVDLNHLLVAVLEATEATSDRQQAVRRSVDRQGIARLQAPGTECVLHDLDDLTFDGLDEGVVVLEIRKHNPHSSAAAHNRPHTHKLITNHV